MNGKTICHKIVTSGSHYLDIDAYACCVALKELFELKGQEAIAYSFGVYNYSICKSLIEEEKLTDQTLLDAVREVYADREKYIHTMSESGQMDSIGTILKLIESVSK